MKAGWVTKTLGDVLVRTETINPTTTPDIEFDYIDVSSISNKTFKVEETQRLKGKDAPSRARRLVRENDILFATIRPTLRRIAIVPPGLDEQVCSTGYFVLRPTHKVHYRFLFYWLFTEDFMGQMEMLQKGASYPAVTDSEVRAQRIPFPSSAEQQRIVAVLDEAFDGIATAKANAEKNLQNARELFESHLREVFSQRGEAWGKAPLSTFAFSVSTGPFGSLLHKSDYVSDGVPLVNPINIVDGCLVPDPEKLIDMTTMQRLGSYVLREGDIVIARRGEIGRCAVIGSSEAGWVCGTGCFFIRPRPTVKPAFLAHLIRSGDYRAQLERASTGTTMKNLSNTTLSNFLISIPNLEQQSHILSLIEHLSEESRCLEANYQQKLLALDNLKQSLLHRAFNGDL